MADVLLELFLLELPRELDVLDGLLDRSFEFVSWPGRGGLGLGLGLRERPGGFG